MHLHILGICGTFMGSLALLARELGHQVSGSDANVYPPMSTQLEAQGIALQEGYDPAHLQPAPDLVIVGNAMSRGNPAVEYMLDKGMPYVSGPEWLARYVLQERWVLAVAGTHGKTSTSSLLAWLLESLALLVGMPDSAWAALSDSQGVASRAHSNSWRAGVACRPRRKASSEEIMWASSGDDERWSYASTGYQPR